MPHSLFPTLSACALCSTTNTPLQQSHLLPNFLFKRLREPAGHFYSASVPEKPLQRGAVARMLCFECEQALSQWEGHVQQAFFPHGSRPFLPIKYGTWLQLFATSISWRCLTFLKHSTINPYVTLSQAARELLPSLPSNTHQQAEGVRNEWGAAIQRRSASVSQNDQHVLFLNGENFSGERCGIVGFTVCRTEHLAAVFSQLGPLCVVGVIEDQRPSDWKNTAVQPLGGKFHVTSQRLPEHFAEWLKQYFAAISQIET